MVTRFMVISILLVVSNFSQHVFRLSPDVMSDYFDHDESLLIPNNLTNLELDFIEYADGFDKPVDIASTGVKGDRRLFIVEKEGVIRIILENRTIPSAPFLNITNRVGPEPLAREQGLLGLAFHPQYETNGYFFLNYTDNGGNTTIARYTVSSGDPNQADPATEFIIMKIDQPYNNHNAGDLAFGPNENLYIPTGDGGSGGDPQNRAQNPKSLLGKILRIDVSGISTSNNYLIPVDNPFVTNPDVEDEIWALGLRNPWRISFDRLTNDLYVGDVGQDDWEEINFQKADSLGGENYGWRCYEGFHSYNLAGCEDPGAYIFPISEYGHGVDISVTGGFVYRGTNFPFLWGYYIFADFQSTTFRVLKRDDQGKWVEMNLGQLLPGDTISTFGEDVRGELFIAGYDSGKIYHITENTLLYYHHLPSIQSDGPS